MIADSAEGEATLAQWIESLKNCGQRLTVPRKILLKAALSCPGPFTAEELLVIARREDRLIALATVYRTLSMVEEAGLIRKVEMDGDCRHYEVARPGAPRAVLECQDCGKVVPLDASCLDLRERYLARQLGFDARQISLRIKAACHSQHRLGHCDRR